LHAYLLAHNSVAFIYDTLRRVSILLSNPLKITMLAPALTASFAYQLEAIDVARTVMRIVACFAVTTVLLVCFVILVLSVAFTLNVLEHAFSTAVMAPTLSIPASRAHACPALCQRGRTGGRSQAEERERRVKEDEREEEAEWV